MTFAPDILINLLRNIEETGHHDKTSRIQSVFPSLINTSFKFNGLLVMKNF